MLLLYLIRLLTGVIEIARSETHMRIRFSLVLTYLVVAVYMELEAPK
jgi:hypothetical protein